MKRQPAILFLLTILAACNGDAVTEPSTMPAESATPAVSAVPTEPLEPAVTATPTFLPTPTILLRTGPYPLASYDGTTLSVEDCDYGGYFQSIEATNPNTVTFTLCKPDPAFLYKIALNAFAIYPKEWIEATSGAEFRTPEGLEKPIGTGPYRVGEWKRGESITFIKNPDYWGYAPSPVESLVFRWSPDPAQRLQALQSGAIDGYDGVSANEIAAIKADPTLQLASRLGLNVFYIGLINTFAPFDNLKVRQAIAMGIDRQHIVDAFYPPGSEAASHFTPCSILYGCAGDAWYEFDVHAARTLLVQAGYAGGFQTKLFYRDVIRDYQPQVSKVAQDIQAQLKENLNINVESVPVESNAFIKGINSGRFDGLYLHGWSAAYPHITNFLDNRFSRNSLQFGSAFPEIYDNMIAGAQSSIPAEAEKYYMDANNAIRKFVPVIPIAHAGSAVAYRADVENPQVSPLAIEVFSYARPGNRNAFTWMQEAEPNSLFCADETDVESLRACAQVMEGLYAYEVNGTAIKPALATECLPDAEQTIWICTLRQGVSFHDGSELDSSDVVATFNMALNPGSPNHKGSTNLWETYDSLWDLMWK